MRCGLSRKKCGGVVTLPASSDGGALKGAAGKRAEDVNARRFETHVGETLANLLPGDRWVQFAKAGCEPQDRVACVALGLVLNAPKGVLDGFEGPPARCVGC